MKILLTAFEPFGGETVNPALEAINQLPETIAGAQIIKLQVPTVFQVSIETVTCAIDEYQPQVCLSTGLAGGRSDIAVERVAINVDDGRLPDNAGVQPVDQPIIPGGPAAYFATLPIKTIVEAICQQGIPATVSNTAGTYVCNHLMYGVLHYITLHQLVVRAGFIHVPYLPSQVIDKPATPSMDLDQIGRALQAAVEVIVRS